MKKSNSEIGKEAAEFARAQTQKSLKRYKVTTGRVAKRLSEALDATEVKTFHEKGGFEKCDDGEYRYHPGQIIHSKPLVAHHIRIKAIDIATTLLEMKPNETKKVIFPDKDGNPQPIGQTMMTDMELANKALWLLSKAANSQEDPQ